MDRRKPQAEMSRPALAITLKFAFEAVVAVLSGCLTISAFAQTSSTQQQPETITSTMELGRVLQDPSADGRALNLTGRLAFAAPNRRVFRIQADGKHIACLPDPSIPDIALTFEAGDLIRVKGRLQSNRTGREPISVNEVSLIQKGSLDDLEFMEAFEGDNVRLWQYVSFTGTVSELIAEGAATRIAFEDQYFGVEALIATSLPLSRQRDLVGRRINVKGMMSMNPAASGDQNHCVRILAMSKDQVTVVETGQQPMQSLHQIDGQIAEVGSDYVIVGGTKVNTRVPHLLHVGCVVNVEVSDWNPNLQSGQLRWLHNRGAAPFPDVPSIKSIPSDNRLMYSAITVTGIVVKTIINDRFTRVYLSTIAEGKDRQIIVAVVPASAGERIRGFKPGTKVLASGVLHPVSEFAAEADYRLNTSSFNGFEIVTDNNELQLHRLKMVVGLGIVCLLAGTVWHYSLRRQVKQKTASLRSLMSHSTAALQSVSQGILVMDKDGRVSMSNANMQTLFGLESELIAVDSHLLDNILARRFADHTEFASLWAASLNDPMKTLAREFKTVAPAGWMAVYTAPILDDQQVCVGRIWTFDDISRRQQLQEDHLQSQKISAIGRLAGGVAHDFNNLLQVIGASLDIVSIRETQDDKLQCLDTASTAVQRAAELTRQLLTYSRRSQLKIQPCNVNDIVHEVSKLMQRVLDARIHFSAVLDPYIGLTNVDPGQLEQVLMNLCINARDALKDGSGHIRISTSAADHPDLGDSIVVCVEDDGVGMPQEIVEKIYEPFFTTKAVGEGTGLGLAMAVGVVEQVGGRIQCDSREGEGTKFEIVLKASAVGESVSKAVDKDPPESPMSARRVLIVDDDMLVLRSGRSLLESLGHQVVCACSGAEAIEVVQNDADFDLIMLDFTMPVMSGQETLEQIRGLPCGIPIYICSGYAEQAETMSNSQRSHPDGFLSKPFGAADVNRLLKQIGSEGVRTL